MSAPLRHRFEPARLVLGLPVAFAGVGCVLEALGDWRVPVRLLLLVVPVALVLAGVTALTTSVARRGPRERERERLRGTGREGGQDTPGASGPAPGA